MYNVALDVTPEQKRQIKVLAASRGQSVKSLITEIVVRETQQAEKGKKEEERK